MSSHPFSGSTGAPERRRIPLWRALALAGVIALLALGYGGWASTAGRIPVAVEVDGVVQEVLTTAETASELLAELGYSPHPDDVLSLPQGDLAPGARIVIRRARPALALADGVTREVWTQAETVGQLLHEAGIAVGWRDEVLLAGEPVRPDAALPPAIWLDPATRMPARPWEGATEPLEIAIRRAVAFTLIDGDAAPATIVTHAATLQAALDAEAVPIYEGDVVFPPLDSAVTPDLRLVIQRSTPVQIDVDGVSLAARTRRETVGEALAEQGIVLMGLDRVTPALSEALRPNTHILVTRVTEDVVYEDEPIAFDSIWEADADLLIDQRRVAAAGGPGLLRRRYRLRYENGDEVSRVLEDEWVAEEPQTRVLSYGVKIVPQTLETPDGTITYWRKVRLYATSYSPARSGTPRSAPWYGRTRLGMTLRKGIVAVDPSVINMQSRLYIPGYGEAIAGDTGSGVRGRHVDLGYRDNDYVSWHWWTDAYLLWPPPPDYAIRYVLPDWPRYPDRGN